MKYVSVYSLQPFIIYYFICKYSIKGRKYILLVQKTDYQVFDSCTTGCKSENEAAIFAIFPSWIT